MPETYEKVKIGKRIASGADRVVYRYGDTQVIKFSSFSHIVGNTMREKMLHDYEVCKKYFGAYVVETLEMRGEKKSQYIEIQPFIKGTVVSRGNITNPGVREQLKELVSGLEKMKKDGYAPIDLMGHVGFFNLSLNNVFLDESGKLKIIDASLFESKSVGGAGWLFMPFFPVIIMFQEFILKRLLSK
jgi:serine/threonine protein kinase